MSGYWARKAQSYNSSGKQTRYYNRDNKQTATSTTPPPPLGSLFKTLRVNDLDHDPDNQHSATIQDCKVIASYNWLDTSLSEPTILIPGLFPLLHHFFPPQLFPNTNTNNPQRQTPTLVPTQPNPPTPRGQRHLLPRPQRRPLPFAPTRARSGVLLTVPAPGGSGVSTPLARHRRLQQYARQPPAVRARPGQDIPDPGREGRPNGLFRAQREFTYRNDP